MSKRIWKSGPPPHIGWWNASTREDKNFWRWWNGETWSFGCLHDAESLYAAKCANERVSIRSKYVKWCDYYPPNARVPRIDPRLHLEHKT